MSCEPAQHAFRPYPRSRALYCPLCGDVIEPPPPDRPRLAQPAPSAAETALARVLPNLFEPDAGAAPLDPDVPRARDVLAEQRAAREQAAFADRVDEILTESGLEPGAAAELRAQAIAFGPTLDLETLRAAAQTSAAPAPPSLLADE